MCKKQYSNDELDVEARSLSLADLENNMSNEGIEARDAYTLNQVTYGDKKIYTEDNAYIPAIYAELELDTANESLSYYKQPTTNTFTKETSKSLPQTFYKLEDVAGDYFESEEYYDLIFNTVNGSWLATRCIDCSTDVAMFGLFKIENNTIGANVLCASNGKSGSNKNYIRPIVTLGEDIEISELETGTADDPRILTKLDLEEDDSSYEEENPLDDFEEELNAENTTLNMGDNNSSLNTEIDETARDAFNANFIPYEGEGLSAAQVRALLSIITSSNASNIEHQVEIEQPDQIDSSKKYAVEFVYDDNDYIKQTIITEM